MSNDHPSRPFVPYIAVACAATLIGGLLLPKAAFHSVDRGLLVWLIICIATGVILSSLQPFSCWRGLKMSMLTSVVMASALAGFYSVRWLVSRILNIDSPQILIPFESGGYIDILDPRLPPFLTVLALLFWVGSTVVICVATLSGKLLLTGALKLYMFGPDGVDRIRQIVVGLCGVTACLVALWAAFG